MRRKYNELYIGAAVSVTIIMIVASILFLEKANLIQQGIGLNLVVQNAGGIRKGGSVLYEGVEVGSVKSIQFTSGGVLLKLRITKMDSIPDNSTFSIASTSLLGAKSVEITPGGSKAFLKDGAYVKGTSSAGLSDILRSGNRMTADIGEVASNIKTLTDEKTRMKVSAALSRIDESVSVIHNSLKGNLRDIHETIESLKKISTENRAPIDSIVDRLSEHTKDLDAAIDNTREITANLNRILKDLNEGKGTAGKLLTDSELYNEIDSAVVNLNGLVKDIKTHPGKYIHVSIF